MVDPLIVPVRHHSPAAAAYVRQAIESRRPHRILIEGPADATPLIPLLVDPGTVPPIAIYAYRVGSEGRALFYPFCAYSPEYVAMTAGSAIGADVRFCDVPSRVTLDWPPEAAADVATDGERPPGYADFTAALIDATRTSSFEELWEAAFEQELPTSEHFLEAMGDFGARARELGEPARNEHDRLRERTMAASVRAALADGIALSQVLVICGAAHVESVRRTIGDDVDPTVESGAPAEIALIPFSFPRLSDQSGYGAGNRAPWFYQQVWEWQNDYATATRRTLVALAAKLRQVGQPASLAQIIDAYRLSLVLARLRDKLAPGVDELTDAAIACFGGGQADVVREALRSVLIGDIVGQVTHRVGRTPLQSEFYSTANRFRIPMVDAPRQVLLHLTEPNEQQQSIFFQRLTVATIPFAHELETGLGGRNRAASADPLAQLSRVLEKWEVQWSPSTDAALVERTAWGNTLADACISLLRKQLGVAAQVDDATSVLLRLVLCDLIADLPAAIDRCETLAAGSGSFPALARAAYHLDGLLTYGVARQLTIGSVVDLARRLYARAVLHLPLAVTVGDEAVAEVERSVVSLHELVRRNGPIVDDVEAFWDAVRRASDVPSAHPSLRGLCLVLQEIEGRLGPGELVGRLRFWLSRSTEPKENAWLVAGLFSLHRGTVMRNGAILRAVTEFLCELDLDTLIALLPVLRRTLGNLSAAERHYVEETLARALGWEREDAYSIEARPEEIARATAADAEVASVLAGWKERYGLD